ncbi:hypothetical protein BOTBODRAFT_179194 [Botryobasidium botryosum FD-172 SS1]|uniref:Uncharacterized protein n=1 Tax=Botryobasidium botryosum (strain FD-172 SS1) TaxID=930990 RepID=A0A067M0B4_BOTB1|nr:hypothetical protein BOTBODRAFT_179194 [Botryobasidium botryosum FD-172 SS1]
MPLEDIKQPIPANDADAGQDVDAVSFEQLPSYGPRPDTSQAPPYPTELPSAFPIGESETQPLVTLKELEFHLRLLAVFDNLYKTVRECQPDVAPVDPDAKWAVFLARAVHRFDAWATVGLGGRAASGPLLEYEIPPWDVIMVWHTYLLNPRTYYEDGNRSTPLLHKINDFPLTLVGSLISPETHDLLPPSHERVQYFESHTGYPFHYVVSAAEDPAVDIACPRCDAVIPVPWHDESGKGYAQAGFEVVCKACGLSITHEAMGVRKFFNDFVLVRSDPTKYFMAGTLLEPIEGICDPGQATLAAKKIERYFAVFDDGKKSASDWADLAKWTFAGIENCLRAGLKIPATKPLPPRMQRVVLKYRGHYTPSIELTGAIIRQRSFIQKMVDLGWTHPHRFGNNRAILVRCVARYHAFLDLMASESATFFVPTLDIDLSWHTHQLKAMSYRDQTYQLLKRILNHDDRVEEERLSNSFDRTARAWKRRFGVPYSFCGHSQPAEGLCGKFKRFTSKVLKTLALVSCRPDLVSTAGDDAEETSRSSVLFVNHPSARKKREKHEAARTKRLERARQLDEKGKGDGWNALLAKRRQNHPDSFIYAYPYWGITPVYGVLVSEGAAANLLVGAGRAGGIVGVDVGDVGVDVGDAGVDVGDVEDVGVDAGDVGVDVGVWGGCGDVEVENEGPITRSQPYADVRVCITG